MDMQEIHPHPDETYFVGVDDKCLVLGSDEKPKIWLSKAMLNWLEGGQWKTLEQSHKITGVVINETWDLSGELPESLVMWFNVLPPSKRVEVAKQLKEMV